MAPLGPWPGSGASEPVAVAVSGGADSMALAWLVGRWATARGVGLLALVVDHGLRPDSAAEADATMRRLAGLRIPARRLRLQGLATGSALAERARLARYACLTAACREAGAIDLLLGHHADDQAETVLMRRRAASGADGLAGMAALVETSDLRLLRPLLGVSRARLRATLAAAAIAWIEDPSNRDMDAQRVRLRFELAADADGLTSRLLDEAAASGRQRMQAQERSACALAGTTSLHPEGFALLPPGLVPAPALATLIRTIAGAPHRPAGASVERLLRQPRPLTLAGTRLLPAGRLGPGWLLLREAAAMQAEVPAVAGGLWDRRHRLEGAAPGAPELAGVTIGALGDHCAAPRDVSTYPAALLATLPALRRDGALLAVPHLGWTADPALAALRFGFRPAMPATESALFADR